MRTSRRLLLVACTDKSIFRPPMSWQVLKATFHSKSESDGKIINRYFDHISLAKMAIDFIAVHLPSIFPFMPPLNKDMDTLIFDISL